MIRVRMKKTRESAGCAAAIAIVLALAVASEAQAAGKRVALVEEGSAAKAGIGEFSLLAAGTTFELGTAETIVIGYMTSCRRETITGGQVTIGEKQSEVAGGKVTSETVQCGEPRLALSAAESQQSATIAFRPADSLKHVYSRSLLLVGRGGQTIFLEIVEADSGKSVKKLQTETGRFDLAEEKVDLKPGKTYHLKTARNTVMVEIDPAAKTGGSRLERVVLID